MKSKLRVVVVGMGGIGNRHADMYKSDPLAELVGVCDLNKERADAGAARLGVPGFTDAKKMFAALKPGGYLVIADHSAKPGDGANVGKTLHRIEEATLRHEIEAAGFKFVEDANFLRNPNDPRDAAVFHPQQPNDEFVLKYQKPM